MIRKRLGRLATVFTAGTMALLLLGVGSATAKTPSGWSIDPVRLPTTVKPGNDAGYFVTIRNIGPSNVNNVTFSAVPAATPNATPSFFSGLSPAYPCTTTGQLVCNLGTMTAGTVITLTVAYAVPDTSIGTFDVAFRLRAATGDVEGGNQSRGDAYEKIAKTGLNSSPQFDAGFVVDDFSYATSGSLGRSNKQNSQIDVTDEQVTVTVEDDPYGNSPPCDADDDTSCTNFVGDWLRLTVPNNQDYIKVTLNIWGGSVPGGVGADDITLIHVLDNGTVEEIGDDTNEICADANVAPASGQCILVFRVGSNYRLVAWLTNNGGMRGVY